MFSVAIPTNTPTPDEGSTAVAAVRYAAYRRHVDQAKEKRGGIGEEFMGDDWREVLSGLRGERFDVMTGIGWF